MIDVVIVSKNPETIDGLQRYLREAGLATVFTRDLDECAAVGTANTAAFVFFPDDFPYEHVIVTLASLSEQRPFALPVLVTARPDPFERLTTVESVLIVPRPVWGWAILEAIRDHQAWRRKGGSHGRR